MTSKRETRTFMVKTGTKENDRGIPIAIIEKITYNYTLWVDDNGTLIDIRNEYSFSVEKESECFEFFNKKHTQNV